MEKIEGRSVITTVTLPVKMRLALVKFALKEERSMSMIMVFALREYFKKRKVSL